MKILPKRDSEQRLLKTKEQYALDFNVSDEVTVALTALLLSLRLREMMIWEEVLQYSFVPGVSFTSYTIRVTLSFEVLN